MLRPQSPIDLVAAALAAALGILAWTQWSAASTFTDDAIAVEAKVVELRTAKRQLLEPTAEVFARVEFETLDGARVEAELPTPVRQMGPDSEAFAPGASIPILYDPARPERVRSGPDEGKGAALILATLAAGALFVPGILRRSSLARMAGGGGG